MRQRPRVRSCRPWDRRDAARAGGSPPPRLRLLQWRAGNNDVSDDMPPRPLAVLAGRYRRVAAGPGCYYCCYIVGGDVGRHHRQSQLKLSWMKNWMMMMSWSRRLSLSWRMRSWRLSMGLIVQLDVKRRPLRKPVCPWLRPIVILCAGGCSILKMNY